MACRFSKDGKYFGQLSNDGKLQIWHTASNKFVQEFTPDVHLTAPCTCLHFIQAKTGATKSDAPRKKVKRRSSAIEDSYIIALGTTSGSLLMYSVDKAELIDTITSGTACNISCISYQEGAIVFTGADQYVLQWNLTEKVVNKKWKSGNERITAILQIPGENKVITAARLIKLWDTETQQVLKTLTGHKSEITIIDYISSSEEQSYVITGSKSDRMLSCWNLSTDVKDKNAIANFMLEDSVRSVNVTMTDQGATSVTASVLNGALHVFEHTLNGKCTKPLKPKTTIKIASNSTQNGQALPIPIISAFLLNGSITLVYGSAIFVTFESIVLNTTEKTHCLIRSDMRSIEPKSKDKKKSAKNQVIVPILDNVTYLTPHTSNKTTKRKSDGGMEVAMEKRLQNLTVAASAFNTASTSTDSVTPQANNVAQLLIQGLHSGDKEILTTVLTGQQHKEQVITNTVRRLKMPVLQLLIAELVKMIQSRTFASETGSVWLKHILHCHAGLLLANPELVDLLSPALNAIQSRLSLTLPLHRLHGRLDLVMSQIGKGKQKDGEVEGGEALEEAMLVYNDKALSDDELTTMDVTGAASDSDMDEWNEDSDNNSDDDDSDSKNDIDMDVTAVTANGQSDSDVSDEDDAMSS